jgi:hypothetical protein
MHGVEVGSTARLRFRAVTDVDVSRLFTLMGDPRVKRGEPRSPAPNHPSFVDTIKSMINMAVFSVSSTSPVPFCISFPRYRSLSLLLSPTLVLTRRVLR